MRTAEVEAFLATRGGEAGVAFVLVVRLAQDSAHIVPGSLDGNVVRTLADDVAGPVDVVPPR